MAVAGGVVGRRTGDAIASQALGDEVQPPPGQPLREDPPYDGSSGWVGLEAVKALANDGLPGVGVRAGVNEKVAVRWPPAEESPLRLGLGGHGRANPDLYAIALALGHSAIEAHHQVVGVRARIDAS